MKRSDYFYSVLLLGIVALIIYGFLNYFLIMAGLIAFSSTFSFVVFLIQTRIKTPIEDVKTGEQPIDFYKSGTRTTYYQTGYNVDGLKQVNSAN